MAIGTTAKEMLNKVKENKSLGSSESVMEKTRGSITASLVGAGIGLGIGYYQKQNLLVSAFLGALVSGLVANYFIGKK